MTTATIDPGFLRPRVQAFLNATAELGLAEHLADLDATDCVLAPEALLEEIRKARPHHSVSLTSGYDSPPLFYRRIYVYDIFPGSPSRFLKRLHPEVEIIVINRDLVVDLVIRGGHGAPKAKVRPLTGERPPGYCILNTPRSGGLVLAQLMRAAGLGKPKPHLREPLGASMREGFSASELMSAIRAGSPPSAAFGTVINIQFVNWALAGRLVELVEWIVSNDIRCIRVRRDVREQALSLHLAARTGLWETWGKASDEYADVVLDRQQILKHAKDIRDLESLMSQLLLLCGSAQVLTIDYQEFEHPERVLKRIEGFLGVELDAETRARTALPFAPGSRNSYMRHVLEGMNETSF